MQYHNKDNGGLSKLAMCGKVRVMTFGGGGVESLIISLAFTLQKPLSLAHSMMLEGGGRGKFLMSEWR